MFACCARPPSEPTVPLHESDRRDKRGSNPASAGVATVSLAPSASAEFASLSAPAGVTSGATKRKSDLSSSVTSAGTTATTGANNRRSKPLTWGDEEGEGDGEKKKSKQKRPSEGRMKALGTSLRNVFLAREDSNEYIDEEKVIKKQEKWLRKEEKRIEGNTKGSKNRKTHAQNWDKVFDDMCRKLGKTELTFQEMDSLFVSMGLRINHAMLGLLFRLFDVNGDNVVDRQEFRVSATFLTARGANKDTIDLAFRLFDYNRSGTVSKREFIDMTLSMMARATFVLSVPAFREAFRTSLKENLCVENIDFYEAVEKARRVLVPRGGHKEALSAPPSSQRRTLVGGRGSAPASRENSEEGDNAEVMKDFYDAESGGLGGMVGASPEVEEVAVFSLSDAQAIYDNFVSQAATSQVNLSDANRKGFERALAEARDAGAAEISSKTLDACVAEILKLMETDSLPRLVSKLKKDRSFVDAIWKEEGIKSSGMSKRDFRRWAEKNPNVFSFLADLQKTMRRAEHRQRIYAVMKIQRWWRAKSKGKLVRVVLAVNAAAVGDRSPTVVVEP